MARKIAVLSVILVTVGALLLISCSPKASAPTPSVPTSGTPTPAVSTPATPAPGTPAAPTPAAPTEKPKYGGTVNVVYPNLREGFDAAGPQCAAEINGLVHDQFLYFDWAKGLAGSGEVDWGSLVQSYEGFTGEIAESWKIPEIGTWVFQIRRDVHFALDPTSEASRLVNGREFTADDAVWNVRRFHADPAFSGAGVRRSHPAMSAALRIEKTGPWEVTLKTPVDPWTGFFWVVWGGCSQQMYAREVIEKYGRPYIAEWRHMVGTGPYMVTDYVSGSVATFKKNPNWYKKDPVGPGKGNQVPYVDTFKWSFVPDLSTRMAVMRTGKGDWVSDIQSEDARSLFQTTPTLKYKRFLPFGNVINMRIDKAELPFKDKRVRQALMMATDFETIKNELYGGDAEIQVIPVLPTYDFLFVPMEKLPESVQALYKYNPAKAKQLLAEAGYPNGFKTKLVIQNASNQLDSAQVLKAMWAKAGVDLEIQPREAAVYASLLSNTQEELYLRAGFSPSIATILELGAARSVPYGIKDPSTLATYDEMQKYVFINMPKVEEIYRKWVPYDMEQVWVLPLPSVYSYTIWQPWLKNYYGEPGNHNYFGLWHPYVWVDQDLKEKMTGRR